MKSQPLTSMRERYRKELRRTILDAARDAFSRDGYEHLSMRTLGERIGCSHGNIYLHFKDKEELFDCLVEESFDQLAETLRSLRKSEPEIDSVTLLRKAGRAYVEFGLRNPGAYEFAFLLRRPGRPRPRKPHLAYEYLRNLVGRCLSEKRLRKPNVDVASQAIWTAVHGVTSLLILRPSFPWADKEAIVGRVVDSAVDGVVALKKAK